MKNFDKIVGIVLVILTVISLIIDLHIFALGFYNEDGYQFEKLGALINGTPFTILQWVDNCLIYLFAFLYIVSAIDTKREMLVKISFSVFSLLTTSLIMIPLINFVATCFGIL